MCRKTKIRLYNFEKTKFKYFSLKELKLNIKICFIQKIYRKGQKYFFFFFY